MEPTRLNILERSDLEGNEDEDCIDFVGCADRLCQDCGGGESWLIICLFSYHTS